MAIQEDKFNRRRLRTSYLTSVISISLVLFMLGLLGLIVLHAKKLSDYVKENISLSVIIKDNVKENRIRELQRMLDVKPFIKSTRYVTKEEAAAELTRDLGEDFQGFLGYNPLLPSIDVRVKAEYANQNILKRIENEMMGNKIVKEVFYQKSLVDMVNENIRKISMILLGFSAILLVIAIVLINNTIRLSVYSKRFIIRSMQLVGATQGFIQKPFLVRGVAQGLYGSFIALILLGTVLYFSQKQIPELVNLQDVNMFATLFGLVTLLGILISLVSTRLAVRKYIMIKTDSLYY